jgi:hypothetical protein
MTTLKRKCTTLIPSKPPSITSSPLRITSEIMMYYSACKTVIQLKAARANVLLKVHPINSVVAAKSFKMLKRVRHETRSPRACGNLAEALEAREAKAATDARNAEALKKRNEDPLVQAAAGLSVHCIAQS